MRPKLNYWRGGLLAMLLWFVAVGFANEATENQAPKSQPNSAAAGEDLGKTGSKQTQALQRIGSIMTDVKTRLHSRDTSQQTRALQQDIIAGLSNLIDEQSQSNSQQSGMTRPTQPPRPADGQRPGPANGQGETPSGEDGTGNPDLLLGRIWGNLPDEIRQQVETPLHDKFLPQYDDLIQEYFKRLATETPK